MSNKLEQEFKSTVGELKELVHKGIENRDEEFNRINEKLDEIEDVQLKVSKLEKSLSERSPNGKSYDHANDFAKALDMFARDQKQRSSISEEIDFKAGYDGRETKTDNIVRFDMGTGGALQLPAELSRDIIHDVVESTPVMNIVRTSTTNAPQKKRVLRVSRAGGDWLEEEAVNTKTKPEYKTITHTPKMFAARYGYTIASEMDAAHDIVNELMRSFREDFDVSVGTAVVKGDGNGKPKGMLGNIRTFDSGSTTLGANMLIKMQEDLKEDYQNNGSWLFTRQTRAAIRTLFLTSNDASLQYLWEPDFTRRSPTLLLGNPVFIAKEDDLAGSTSGTYSAGQSPVIYGDFQRGYEVVLRNDMYMIDDPYSESDRFVRNLNIMSRVDGQPLQKDALVELNITTS